MAIIRPQHAAATRVRRPRSVFRNVIHTSLNWNELSCAERIGFTGWPLPRLPAGAGHGNTVRRRRGVQNCFA
jgi:hypothetical protein